jgi:hypothetical protein
LVLQKIEVHADLLRVTTLALVRRTSMFTDDARCRTMNQVQPLGLEGFARFLTPQLFAEAERVVKCVRRGPLSLACLTWLGVAAALHTTKSFAGVLSLTCKLLNDAPACLKQNRPKTGRRRRDGKQRSKHDPRGGQPDCVSEEAFAKARQSMPWEYWCALIVLLADRFANQHDARVRWKGLRLLALDGTLLSLPREDALREHFGTARNQRGGRKPQARLVLMEFALTRVPFRFRLTPKNCAEKTSAAALLKNLQRHDLVLMDRGFWSYGLFCQIEAQQAYFAIRLIKQAKLPVVRKLGPGDALVRFAPRDKRWRRLSLPKDLVLRRIEYKVPGFRQSAVITNATDPQQISREDWVGQAVGKSGVSVLNKTLYHHRWEIETTFDELKVRQGMNQLRSHTPLSVRYEIAGHLTLYLLTRWLIVEAAEQAGVEPLHLSFLAASRELQEVMPLLVLSPIEHVRRVVLPNLLKRIGQNLVRQRPGRHYPRPNDTKTKNLGHGRKQKPAKLKRKG